MGIGDKLLAKTANIEVRKPDPDNLAARPEGRTSPGRMMGMQTQVNSAHDRIQELEQKLASAWAREIPLDQLHEVPGRRRHKSPEEYVELRENLRHNKMMHPITVCARAEGGYEIVSGHWRTDAYREIGRSAIKAVSEDGSEDEMSAGAFYANLMQSDLTDFEKFRGFQELQRRHPGVTQERMAEQAGVDPSAVSRLMKYEDLPAQLLELLEQRPGLLGSTYSSDLARLTREGKGAKVIEAVIQLASGKVDQTQAVRLAAAAENMSKATTPTQTLKIKAGRNVYCNVRVSSNVFRLQFQDEAEAQAVQKELCELLERRAALRTQYQDADSEK